MDQLPLLSIVIPTYARPERLAKCLRGMCALDYPKDRFEVIVSDDGSDPPLDPIIEQFRNQLNVRLVRQEHIGVSQARNNGAANANGEFILFTDDDCIPATDWPMVMAQTLLQKPDHAIGGRIVNALEDNIYSSASQLLITFIYHYFVERSRQIDYFASNNLAVEKARFHEVGGFDPTAKITAEDRLFCDQWQARGYHLSYQPQAIIYHENRATLRSFWHQQYRYGRGVHFFNKHKVRRNKKDFQPLNFYFQLLYYPFTQARGFQAIKLAVLFLLSQIATVAGYLYQRFFDEK